MTIRHAIAESGWRFDPAQGLGTLPDVVPAALLVGDQRLSPKCLIELARNWLRMNTAPVEKRSFDAIEQVVFGVGTFEVQDASDVDPQLGLGLVRHFR